MASRLLKSLLRLGVLGLVALPAGGLPAQSAPGDSAKALLAAATAASAGSTPDGYRAAIKLRAEAAAVFHRLGDRRGEGEALSRIGAAWYQLGEPDSARRYALRAFPLRLQAGDTAGAVRSLAGVLAPSFEALGQADSAIATYHRARALARLTGDPLLESQPTQNLGNLYIALSRADSAFAWLQATIALVRRGGDYRTEGEILNSLAVIHDDLGHADSALAYAGQAWRIGREQHSDTLIAAALQNLGVLFNHRGQADSALSYYRLAYDATTRAADPLGQRQVLLDIGNTLDQLGQADSATAYYREAIRRSRDVNDRRTEARALGNLGIVLTKHRQLDSAAAAYRRVLELHRALENRRGEGIALVNIAKVYAEQGHADSSLDAARKAYAIATEIEYPALESAALNAIGYVFQLRHELDSAAAYLHRDLELSRKIGDLPGEGTSLLMLGLVFQSQRNLASAVAYFDSAAAIKRQVALSAGGDFNRTTFGEKEFELYDAWTGAWLDRAAEIGAARAAIGALAASERGRAQALLDMMNRAADSGAVGKDLVAWGEELVRGATRNGTSILVYHLSPDTLTAWTASAGSGLQVHRMAIRRDSLEALVAAFRGDLGVNAGGSRLASRGIALEPDAVRGPASTPPTGSRWRSAASGLARVLLPPAVEQAIANSRELLIVPQGVLALIPFNALPWRSGSGLLGADMALRYSPSLATAVAAETRPRPAAASGQALVVGNPFMPAVQAGNGERAQLTPLPGAEAEAGAIATRLHTVMLGGVAASETAIRRRLPEAAIVHFATHGYAYATEGQARNSFVAFAADSLNDGLLTVGEILDDPSVRLTADLVALSACQTGLGDLKQAEGTVGLQRAFLAKGARSVLVSLWNVSDLATRLLMERFYVHLLDDADHADKAEALRRAQTDVRARPGFEHPRFWAGFQLVGAR